MTQEKDTQVVEVKATPNLPSQDLISQAIEKNADPQVMADLYKLHKEMKSDWAQEQFDAALAAFQMDCPTISKTKSVPTRSGQTAYSYAPLESIVAQVKEILRKHGFSYTIKTDMGEGTVKSTCFVRHINGHQEESSMEVPLGTKTVVMSDSQVVAAAATFSKRYAFCNAFGIMTGDSDTDGMVHGATEKAPEVDLIPHKDAFTACKNMQDVSKVYKSLPKGMEKNTELINHANDVIARIQEDEIPIIEA